MEVAEEARNSALMSDPELDTPSPGDDAASSAAMTRTPGHGADDGGRTSASESFDSGASSPGTDVEQSKQQDGERRKPAADKSSGQADHHKSAPAMPSERVRDALKAPHRPGSVPPIRAPSRDRAETTASARVFVSLEDQAVRVGSPLVASSARGSEAAKAGAAGASGASGGVGLRLPSSVSTHAAHVWETVLARRAGPNAATLFDEATAVPERGALLRAVALVAGTHHHLTKALRRATTVDAASTPQLRGEGRAASARSGVAVEHVGPFELASDLDAADGEHASEAHEAAAAAAGLRELLTASLSAVLARFAGAQADGGIHGAVLGLHAVAPTARRLVIQVVNDARDALGHSATAARDAATGPASSPQAWSAVGADGAGSALLSAVRDGRAGVVAQFSGQGCGEQYWAELAAAFATYPAARRFVRAVAPVLVDQAATPEAQELDLHPRGLDVLAWLGDDAASSAAAGERPSTDAEAEAGRAGSGPPPDAYLTSAPVSYPLIGLTALTHYAVSLDLLGVSQADMVGAGARAAGSGPDANAASAARPPTVDTGAADEGVSRECVPLLSGVTGHSQGLVPAVVVASSADDDELVANARAMLAYLFWQGSRMQAATNALPDAMASKRKRERERDRRRGRAASRGSREAAAEAAAAPGARSTAASDGGGATPMLAVLGLSQAVVGSFVERANANLRLPEGNRIEVALINGPRACVLAGHPDALAALQEVLKSKQAAPGEDQSRVPHSQRKLAFTTRFLPVTSLFHCSQQRGSVARVHDDAMAIGVTVRRSQLLVPVWAEDGRDLSAAASPTAATAGSAVVGSDADAERDGDHSLLLDLIVSQSLRPVNWGAVTASIVGARNAWTGARTTHVLDFGPGQASGSAGLTARNAHGRGVQIVLASTSSLWAEGAGAAASGTGKVSAGSGSQKGSATVLGMAALLSADDGALPFAPDWGALYAPVVVDRRLALPVPPLRASSSDTEAIEDRDCIVSTKLSRLLGRPPVVVGGMTPTTSYYGLDLVAGIANAGFQAELAAGGLPRPAIVRERVSKLVAKLTPGEGIAVNMLYLNARQWAFQLPLIAQLRQQGAPIDGVTVAAGVPSPDKAQETLAVLREAGVRWVAFKPGSVAAIRAVVAIAESAPDFPVIMQWTGGRGGGHHSFEDLHEPIVETYGLIRSTPNVVLVVGSGFGDADGSLPYLTGTWSTVAPYGLAPMPFDGVLLASRMMVAREASTAPEVKALLVSTPGIPPARQHEWERSYKLDADAGGVITVKSELGEPIHIVANRGARLWREFDARFFAIADAAKRAAAIARCKAEIVRRLNDDFQKPFFGVEGNGAGAPDATNAGGRVVDIADMTYAALCRRMVDLTFVTVDREHPDAAFRHEAWTPTGRWLDITYRDRLHQLLLRSEERLQPASEAATAVSAVPSAARLSSEPMLAVEAFFDAYPRGNSQPLCGEDVDFFLRLCRSGGKPVPFVPVIDGDLETWMKKDSLWYSEDLAAVADRDAGRVIVLQGPVAVYHCTSANEPAGDILRSIHEGWVRRLREGQAGVGRAGAASTEVSPSSSAESPSALVSRVLDGRRVRQFFGGPDYAAYLDAADAHAGNRRNQLARGLPVPRSRSDSHRQRDSRYDFNVTYGSDEATGIPIVTRRYALAGWSEAKVDDEASLPSAAEWQHILTSDMWSCGWKMALLTATHIVRGRAWVENPVRRLFAPRYGQAVELVTVALPPTAASATSHSQPSLVESMAVYDASIRRHGPAIEARVAPQSEADRAEGRLRIAVTVHDARPGRGRQGSESVALRLEYDYVPLQSYSLIHQVTKGWVDEVKRFYHDLWFPTEVAASGAAAAGGCGTADRASGATSPAIGAAARGSDLSAVRFEHEFSVTRADVDAFNSVIGADAVSTSAGVAGAHAAPFDFAIVCSWRSLIRTLFPNEVDGDLLSLVHLSNSFQLIDSLQTGHSVAPVRTRVLPGETISTSVAIVGVSVDDRGKVIKCEAVLQRRRAASTTGVRDADGSDDEVASGREPWVRLTSEFLFRGQFEASTPAGDPVGFRRFEQTFPVWLADDAAVAVLSSKPWLTLSEPSKVGVGARLVAQVEVVEQMADTKRSVPARGDKVATLRAATVRGELFVRAASATSPVKHKCDCVGVISFSGADLVFNPVTAYLESVGDAPDALDTDISATFETGGYNVLTTPDVTRAPASNLPYAVASLDLNPIHRNAYAARLAGLPGTITHGMWTSALARRVLATAVGRGGRESDDLIANYAVNFVGMVCPLDELSTQVKHVGMRNGRRLLQVEVARTSASAPGEETTRAGEIIDAGGDASPPEIVLRASAEVDMPLTAYVFTGQGSASVGMGMALRDTSPQARQVWDAADAHLIETFGFSIVDIVTRNPQSLTIHFGGRRGAKIRANYVAMTVEAPDGSGTVPLIPEITPETEQYTFVHPQGLLYATQFTQPALVLTEKAAFDDMRAHGLIPPSFYFCGHSLGEYSCLSSAARILTIEALVQLVFLRGLTMQRAVQRHPDGSSDFGMVAANPGRVGSWFDEQQLHAVVTTVAERSGELLEVVNFNVVESQYVIAGHLVALDTMRRVLDALKAAGPAALGVADPSSARALGGAGVASARNLQRARRRGRADTSDSMAAGSDTDGVVHVAPSAQEGALLAVVDEALAATRAEAADSESGRPVMRRGTSTIPLEGIDMPFHSKFLRGGVPAFRQHLQQQIGVDMVGRALSLLEGRYIPNVVASPFSLDRAYVESVYRATDSPVLARILEDDTGTAESLAAAATTVDAADGGERGWARMSHPSMRARLGYRLLVELLAYQFASPVQWIDTQHLLFTNGVQRVVEIGPARTLATMAQRTLATGRYGRSKREILWNGRDQDALFFQFEDRGLSALEHAEKRQRERHERAQQRGSSRALASTAVGASGPAAAAAAPSMAAPAPVPVAASAAGPVPDVMMSALDAARVIVAVKLHKPLAAVNGDSTVSGLAAGKSSLSNEVMGDLDSEFGGLPGSVGERGSELPLKDLAAAVKSYSKPGKVTTAMVSRLLSSAMPGGFGAADVRARLATTHGLGPLRAHSALLQALGDGVAPSGRLGSAAEASAWVDKAAQAYCAAAGVTAASTAASAAPVAASAMAMPAAAPAVSGSVPDAPVAPVDFLSAMLATKLSLASPDEVDTSKSIKDLTGGKSAVQNEIIGEVEAEYGPAANSVDGAAELPLKDLGARLQTTAGEAAGKLGKVSQRLLSRFAASALPAGQGMAAVRADLQSRRGLGPGRTDSVLLRAAVSAPHARFASAAEATAFLDGVVDAHLSKAGVSAPAVGAPSGGAGTAGAAGAAGALVVSGAFHDKLSLAMRDQIEALQHFVGDDPALLARRVDSHAAQVAALQTSVDAWRAEHGEMYERGILPAFDPRRARVYASTWNWVRVDVFAHLAGAERRGDDAQLVRGSVNRATPELRDMAAFMASHLAHEPLRAVELATSVAEAAGREVDLSRSAPVYVADFTPMAPAVKIHADGRMEAGAAPRPGVPTAAAYVDEMTRGCSWALSGVAAPTDARHEDEPWLTLRSPSASDAQVRTVDRDATAAYFSALRDMAAGGAAGMAAKGVSFAGKVALVTGAGRGSIGAEIVRALLTGGATVIVTTSSFSQATTHYYRAMFEQAGSRGSSLTLVPFNGASRTDVSALVDYLYDVRGLDVDILVPFAAMGEGGRNVTGLDDRSELAHRLMLTNVLRLVGAVVNAKKSRRILTRPAAVLLPLSPNHGVFGNDGLYAESKLSLEALLNKWGAEGWDAYASIAGAVIGWTRSTGLMADNDMVAEGVEELGCRTFSQAEMAFNLVALLHPRMIARAGYAPLWADLRGGFGAVPDLRGVTAALRAQLRAKAATARAVHIAADKDASAFAAPAVASGAAVAPEHEGGPTRRVRRRANLAAASFPDLPDAAAFEAAPEMTQLRGMLDLARTVVVVGYGEVGPWGSARTRWEMEASGTFSIEGCIELAWLTGLIRYHAGPTLPDGSTGEGWVDAKTGELVPDATVKERYEAVLLQHGGVRVIEPALMVDGYDPAGAAEADGGGAATSTAGAAAGRGGKTFLHTVAIDKPTGWVDVASPAEADEYRAELGDDMVDVRCHHPDSSGAGGEGQWQIRLRRGATLAIPRALRFDRTVAGQLPTGWDATRLGVPADIAASVDPVTLYSLVSTAEALHCAGMSDPYELYEYVHVSEVGTSAGGGMGGMKSLRGIFRGRFTEDYRLQADLLQESFINTVPAWVQMLLLSSSGPVKTPVGACATAAESVDIAVETIRAGKAQVMIAGGFDDFGEEGSYEFAQMKATSSAVKEAEMGREPSEMSRPTATTRAGFMESQGAGMQVLMSARLAVAMGAPIYGVVALSSTATDKQGRSVPAPGQGILTTARQAQPTRGVSSAATPTSLSVSYRAARLKRELAFADATYEDDVEAARAEAEAEAGDPGDEPRATSEATAAALERRLAEAAGERDRSRAASLSRWGNDFFLGDARIAPLRGALAVFGLSIDDVAVASFHGTGTTANDKNESEVTHLQMEHLGRSRGNPLLVVCQKSLTGHPKGAAAAWMLNGLLQCMQTGVVPGNRNADDIDVALRKFSHLLYPNRSLKLPAPVGGGAVPAIKAALLKSFGFGQAGAEILIVHPNYLLATLEPQALAGYTQRRGAREASAYRQFQEALTGKRPFVGVKDAPPYAPSEAQAVYLDPLARAAYDPLEGSWRVHVHRRGGAVEAAAPVTVSPAAATTVTARTDAHAPSSVPTTRGPLRPSSVAGQAGPRADLPMSDSDAGRILGLHAAAGAASGRSRPGASGGSRRRARLSSVFTDASASDTDRDDAHLYPRDDPSGLDHEGNAGSPPGGGLDALREAMEGVAGSMRGADAAATAAAGGSRLPAGAGVGIGVDVEPLSTFTAPSATFLTRNFTPAELEYCQRVSPNATASLAGRWCAKEAVIKAITSAATSASTASAALWKGSGAALSDIEILPSAAGSPVVVLHGHAADVAARVGVSEVTVSISHTDECAVAQAMAR